MKFLCVLSSLLACVQILAVGRNISFNRLDVEDGLSSAPVYDILPDPAAPLWLSVWYGGYFQINCAVFETKSISL